MPSTDVQVHLQLAKRNKRQEKRTVSDMNLGDEYFAYQNYQTSTLETTSNIHQ
jgi:hypothetical protein